MAEREGQDSEQALTVGGGERPSVGQSPESPVTAVVLASGPTFGDVEPSTGFVNERSEAAREAAEKRPPPKRRDILNEIVGTEVYGTTWSAPGWINPKTDDPFEVTRYYMHKKVAIDFPDAEQMASVPMKRAVLGALGVVYIVIGPNEQKTKQQITDAIEAERARLQRGS